MLPKIIATEFSDAGLVLVPRKAWNPGRGAATDTTGHEGHWCWEAHARPGATRGHRAAPSSHTRPRECSSPPSARGALRLRRRLRRHPPLLPPRAPCRPQDRRREALPLPCRPRRPPRRGGGSPPDQLRQRHAGDRIQTGRRHHAPRSCHCRYAQLANSGHAARGRGGCGAARRRRGGAFGAAPSVRRGVPPSSPPHTRRCARTLPAQPTSSSFAICARARRSRASSARSTTASPPPALATSAPPFSSHRVTLPRSRRASMQSPRCVRACGGECVCPVRVMACVRVPCG